MEIDRNCWRKLDIDQLPKLVIIPNSPASLNEGQIPVYIKVPRTNKTSYILTEYDHDSPNDDITQSYTNEGAVDNEPISNLIIKNNGNQKPSLIEAYGRLWASSGRFVRFSKPGEPEYWPRQNSLSFNDNITGLLQVSNGILAFTADETYLIVGSSINDFAITLLTKEQGCIAPRSCGYIQSVPIWMCKDGIATYEGGRVIVRSRPIISEKMMGHITSGDNFICAEVHNEQYFILYKTDEEFVGPAAAANAGIDGKKTQILCMDLRYGVSFYTIDGDTPEVYNSSGQPLMSNYYQIRDLRMYEDKLYAVGTNNNIYEMFAADTGTDGEQYYSIRYKSPIITEGSQTTLKEIDSIYISAKDTKGLSINYYNGETDNGVLKKIPLITNMDINSISQELKCPMDKARFEEIQLEITGIVKGHVREIRFLSTISDNKTRGYL